MQCQEQIERHDGRGYGAQYVSCKEKAIVVRFYGKDVCYCSGHMPPYIRKFLEDGTKPGSQCKEK